MPVNFAPTAADYLRFLPEIIMILAGTLIMLIEPLLAWSVCASSAALCSGGSQTSSQPSTRPTIRGVPASSSNCMPSSSTKRSPKAWFIVFNIY